MKRAWSIVWKIALVCGVAGIVLTLVGLSRGWPQSVAWGSEGARVAKSQDIEIDQTVAPFTAIAVNVSVLDVTVVTGDHYGVAVHWPNTVRDVNVTDDNGTLKVNDTGPRMVMTWYGDNGGTVTITVPNQTTLASIDVTSGTGNVSASAPAQSANLTSPTGDVDLTATADQALLRSSTGKVRANADIASLNATSSTGDVTLAGQFGTIEDATSSTGNVSVSGSATSVKASTSTGNVTISLSAAWAATTYSLDTDTGRIVTGGPGAPSVSGGGAGNHHLSGTASGAQTLALTANSSTGDVSLTLGG